MVLYVPGGAGFVPSTVYFRKTLLRTCQVHNQHECSQWCSQDAKTYTDWPVSWLCTAASLLSPLCHFRQDTITWITAQGCLLYFYACSTSARFHNKLQLEAKVGAPKHVLSMNVWVLDFDDCCIVVAFHFRHHVAMAKAAAKYYIHITIVKPKKQNFNILVDTSGLPDVSWNINESLTMLWQVLRVKHIFSWGVLFKHLHLGPMKHNQTLRHHSAQMSGSGNVDPLNIL